MVERKSRNRGFTRTSSLLQSQIRKASESRGFAQSRILTHWAEIAGPDLAAMCRPVDVKFGRGGLGATLTVLTTGANAPQLEMQKEKLREKVNAVYGYNAISKVRITQTAATGFAEGRADFRHRAPRPTKAPPPPVEAAARAVADGIKDDGLRAALERLASNVYAKTQGGA